MKYVLRGKERVICRIEGQLKGGEIINIENDKRCTFQAANGSVHSITANDIKEIYGDGVWYKVNAHKCVDCNLELSLELISK